MQYDDTLKLLLRSSARATLREITGRAVKRWVDIELPKPRSLRLDLLGEAADRTLIHLELQSTNDSKMPLRMAEYCVGVYRVYRRIPWQFCLYVGEPRLRMKSELRGAGFVAAYTLIDIRDLDGDPLVDSPDLSDNLIAILARLRDHKDAIRRIVRKVSHLQQGAREAALFHLLTLAGLRRMAGTVREEIEKMPVYIDLSKNEVLGPPYKEGLKSLLRLQMEKRFGPLPAWAEDRLANKSAAQLQKLGVRLLDATSLDELLK
jgi:hypothetical protein